jgi:molybdopterin-binding protein
MNTLQAVVTNIQKSEHITIMSFISNDVNLKMMALEVDDTITKDTQVTLGIKAASISLAKQQHLDISISNQLPCQINNIIEGDLLTVISLDFANNFIESVITRDSARRMELEVGQNIFALFKSSELFIIKSSHE